MSYVKFLDSETVVTASTDNTLKLWDLNKTSSGGLSSNACSLTFRGHTNEKVGFSLLENSFLFFLYLDSDKPFVFICVWFDISPASPEFCGIIRC